MAHIGSSYVTTIERLEDGVLALRGHIPDLAKIKRRAGYIGMGHFGNDLWPRLVKSEIGARGISRADTQDWTVFVCQADRVLNGTMYGYGDYGQVT